MGDDIPDAPPAPPPFVPEFPVCSLRPSTSLCISLNEPRYIAVFTSVTISFLFHVNCFDKTGLYILLGGEETR